MSVSWPTAKKTFAQVVNGVTKLVASLFNSAYDEIEAMQTYLGSPGASQAHNTDVLSYLEAQLPRITLSYVDADTIQASIGVVVCSNSAGSIRKIRKNTSTVNITFSDLDTGSRATNTQYYVYANADATATTVTFKISASDTTPTGVTCFRKIGKFKTNSTGSGEIIESSVFSEGYFNLNLTSQSIGAWVHFDGTGTPSIDGSFNVSSIVDNGAGDYTINFSIPFANANIALAGLGGSDGYYVSLYDTSSITTTSVRIVTRNYDGTASDKANITLIAVGQLAA